MVGCEGVNRGAEVNAFSSDATVSSEGSFSLSSAPEVLSSENIQESAYEFSSSRGIRESSKSSESSVVLDNDADSSFEIDTVGSSAQSSSIEITSSSRGEAPISSSISIRQANLTWYTSYPDPGSEECIVYNGCQWAGYFAGVDGQMSETWVEEHNIAAVHEKDFDTFALKTLRLSQGDHEIDVVVYDMCADSDCDGCCTQNAEGPGFLIDVESFTAERFGVNDGVVDWYCLDCLNE